MKKFLSTMLALILVLGMCIPMAISASAEEPASDVWDGTANIKWFIDAGGVDGDNYEIKTAEDLAGLAYLVNASVSGAIVKGIYYDADYNVKGYQRGSDPYLNEFFLTRICTKTTDLTLIPGYDFNSKSVKLCADIVLNEGNAADWAEEAPENEWQPIGGGIHGDATYWFGFNGMFDGQGHTVSGLYTATYTDSPSTSKISCVGLFGIVSQNQDYPSVENVTLENFYVRGDYIVGGIVGRFNRAGSLTNCHVKNGYVVGTAQVGALVGGIYKGANMIEYCSVDGVNVKADSYVGGMIGLLNGQTVDITNCYTKATVEGTSGVGVIVGKTTGTIRIKNVYSVVKATATGENATAGIIYASTEGYPTTKAENYYFVKDLNAATTIEVQDGAYDIALEYITGDTAVAFLGFDFDTVWKAVEGGTPIIELREEETDDGEDAGDAGDAGDVGDAGDAGDAGNNGNNENSGNNGNGANNDTTGNTSNDTTSDTNSDTDVADETENKGCGGTIGIASAMVVALTAGAALIIKKKEN